MSNINIKKAYHKFLFIKRSLKKDLNNYKWQLKNYDSYKKKYAVCCSDKEMLSENQKCEIRNFWKNYDYSDTVLHEFYYQKTGKYYFNYVPDDLFIHKIERHYSDWSKADIFENKCYYPMMYPEAKHPTIFAMRQNGIWTDTEEKLIGISELYDRLKTCNTELFLKYATNTFGGHGVFCIKPCETIADEIKKHVESYTGDIVIQYGIKQHRILSELNPSSVNTIRIMSLLRKDKVKIYSSVLRMGVNDSRVDNSSSGGISVGVLPDGRLKDVAYDGKGNRFDTYHPTSKIEFSSIVIPNYEKVIDLVCRCHPRTPYFGLISWDIAIDEDGDPILVEAGFKYGELFLHQLNNGPVLGDDTEEILNEVFGK